MKRRSNLFYILVASLVMPYFITGAEAASALPSADTFLWFVAIVLLAVGLFFGLRWWTKRSTPAQRQQVEDGVQHTGLQIAQASHDMVTEAHDAIMRLVAAYEAKHRAATADVQTPAGVGSHPAPPTSSQPLPAARAGDAPTAFGQATTAPAVQLKDSSMLPLTGNILFQLLVVVATGQHDASLETQLGAQYNEYKNNYGPGGPWYQPELVSEAGRASGLPQFWPPRFAWLGYQERGYGSVNGDKWVWNANLLGPFAQYYKP